MKKIHLPLQQHLDSNQKQAQRLHERFAAQVAFGRWLCSATPDSEDSLSGILDNAENTFAPILESGSSAEIASALSDIEERFSELKTLAEKYTIYCVGHAHIDMNWMWSWPETVAVTNDTFTTVLRLMDEFPGFIFSQSQASVYRIIEKYNPPMLDAIAKRIAEGRWEVTASHWVETEKNIVSAESLCRHILYTREYIKELFGLEPEDVPIDWSPDTFGHAHTVPTYLSKAGVKYLYLHRPGAHGEQPRPRAFRWKAPDGSQVLTWNDMAFGYNGRVGPEVLLRSLRETHDDTGLPFSLFVYGVGDHGGGPTRRDLLGISELDSWPLFPRVVFSTARDFYKRLDADGGDLPTLDYELNFEFTGCYTSQSLIKKANRYAEKKLVGAETASVVSEAAAGTRYPFEIYQEGWRNTLFNHFHDIIPGSGVRDTRTHAHGLYQETVAGTGSSSAIALRGLATEIDTAALAGANETGGDLTIAAGVGRGAIDGGMSEYEYSAVDGTRCVMLFNEIPYDREEVIETTIWEGFTSWTDQESVEFTVGAPDGSIAPAQVIERGGYWGHRYIRIAYTARVPGIGYAVYAIRETDDGTGNETQSEARQTGFAHVCNYALYERGPEGLENSLVRVDLDPVTGGIRRITDKASGADIVGPGDHAPSLLRYVEERPRPMSAWEIDHGGPETHVRLVKLERTHDGPLVASIKATYTVHDSTVVLTYKLNAGSPNLYIDLDIEWNERGGSERGTPALRLAVPADFKDPVLSYEIPFGSIERAMEHGEEVPALRWSSATGGTEGGTAGILLMNDSKHGHSYSGGELFLTLLRSSYHPDTHPEIGNHQVRCALRPLRDPIKPSHAIKLARAFDHPVNSIATDIHEGSLPAEVTAVSWASDALVLDSVKKAQDGKGVICRIHNPAPDQGQATLAFDAGIFGTISDAKEVDLMERPLKSDGVAVKNGAVQVSVPRRAMCTVKVTFE